MTERAMIGNEADFDRTARVFTGVWAEFLDAIDHFPSMASPHEGYAILLEEVDELWDEVKINPEHRSHLRMRAEAIQVAAMAIRFVLDVCDE